MRFIFIYFLFYFHNSSTRSTKATAPKTSREHLNTSHIQKYLTKESNHTSPIPAKSQVTKEKKSWRKKKKRRRTGKSEGKHHDGE